MDKPRILIVEGPDGSGKSTLVEYLEAKLGGIWVHSGVPDNPLLEYLSGTVRAMDVAPAPLIFDRFHLGEQVYGPIMRDGDKLGLEGRVVLEKAMMAIARVQVVLCLPSLTTCLDTWYSRRADEYVKDPEKYKQTWYAFAQVATSLPLMTYNYKSDSLPTLTDRIRNALHIR